jgi:hypothetical protein
MLLIFTNDFSCYLCFSLWSKFCGLIESMKTTKISIQRIKINSQYINLMQRQYINLMQRQYINLMQRRKQCSQHNFIAFQDLRQHERVKITLTGE